MLIPSLLHQLTFSKLFANSLKKIGLPSFRWMVPVLAVKRGFLAAARLTYCEERILKNSANIYLMVKKKLHATCDGAGLKEALGKKLHYSDTNPS